MRRVRSAARRVRSAGRGAGRDGDTGRGGTLGGAAGGCAQPWSPQNRKDKELPETVQQKVMQRRRGLKHPSEETRWELGLFSLEMRRLRGDPITAYKYLKGGCREDGARLFSMLASDRTRSNGHKVKHKKFHLSMRKNFFTLRVAELEQAGRAECRIPLPGDTETHLDTFLCHLLR